MDNLFFINSILLGIGLAMDAFSVSLSNGLHEPRMNRGRMCAIASVYGIFQFAMPLIGWFCVHTIAQAFTKFQKFIPWIALALLLNIGIKMIVDSVREHRNPDDGYKPLTFTILMLQGLATSIDALSVGFTIADHNLLSATVCSAIIGVVTFGISRIGLRIGQAFGTRFQQGSGILGGSILILIGIEIFVKGIFF